MARLLPAALLCCFAVGLARGLGRQAGASHSVHPNEADNDPDALEYWSQLKFGLFMHWGAYSVWGVDASWSLEWASRSWSNPNITTKAQMMEYRKRYWALNRVFNPTQFDPQAWAKAAKAAGFKYVVFTTKHHDGFNMFNTKATNYSIVDPSSPYHKDIYGPLVQAFRQEGFFIGAYFSKADWHTKNYWSSSFPMTRNVDYDPRQNSALWQQFVSFVNTQINEIFQQYKPDILWLDAGWVQPLYQDINIRNIASIARKYNPKCIVVNRVGGIEEDYFTPEQTIPDYPLSYYWETCLTMGSQWAFKPNDTYKDSLTLVQTLADVVAKGGNFLLDIGPQPDGNLPPEALERFADLGAWLALNGEAIYGASSFFPYFFQNQMMAYSNDTDVFQNFRITTKQDVLYVILFAAGDPAGSYGLPTSLTLPFIISSTTPTPGKALHAIKLLGSRQGLTWSFLSTDKGGYLQIGNIPSSPPCRFAFTFKLSYA